MPEEPFDVVTPITVKGCPLMRIWWPAAPETEPNSVSAVSGPSTATFEAFCCWSAPNHDPV